MRKFRRPSAGVLKEIKVNEGQTVPIQTIVAVIDADGAAAQLRLRLRRRKPKRLLRETGAPAALQRNQPKPSLRQTHRLRQLRLQRLHGLTAARKARVVRRRKSSQLSARAANRARERR